MLLTAQMTKLARIVAKLATLQGIVTTNLSAMCAIYQDMWHVNVPRATLLVIEAIEVTEVAEVDMGVAAAVIVM